MSRSIKAQPSGRLQPIRRLAAILATAGVSSEAVAIIGMVLGILAGISFMGTTEFPQPVVCWILGLLFCLLRILCIRVDSYLRPHSPRNSPEEAYTHELPERVSDAVTLIGFGFAADSNHWLGLATALAAIFSAYVRTTGIERGAERKSASTGPMTRVHRLILVSLTALFIVVDFPSETFATPLPQIALWVMFFGCLLTIAMRWLNLRE